VLRDLTSRFTAAGIATPGVDAELLVRHVFGWSRTQVLTAGDAALPTPALDTLEGLAQRRSAREPLQLLIGSVGFRYLDIEVRPGVFIPRPETEVLAGEAIDRTPAGGVVVEPCTGSGAIACAVASETAAVRVVATDIDDAAAALARHNADRLGLPVEVVQGDLLRPVPSELRGSVDVIVCNPPYIAEAEAASFPPEVRWDPIGALVSGPSGHEVTDRLIAEAQEWLRPGGWLVLEVDETRAVQTRDRMTSAGFRDARVVADLTGRDRVVMASA